jgi:histidinol-phosphatase (PHP family)
MNSPLLYETHMHTPLCKHAVGEPEEYARTGLARGLRGIIVTCHNPMPDGFSASVRMAPEEFDTYRSLVDRARHVCRGQIEVHLGLECDYFPGYERWLERQVESAPFQYILGSVHPQIRAYQTRFFGGDAVEFQRTYYTHLAEAAELRLFDTLSHPDIVKNCFPDEWDLPRILDHVRRSLDRIAKTGIAMELNTSGLDKTISEFNPGDVILHEMLARDIPIVIGADAHVPGRVADDFEIALDTLEAIGYQHVSYFLERRRRDVPIAMARATLRQIPV